MKNLNRVSKPYQRAEPRHGHHIRISGEWEGEGNTRLEFLLKHIGSTLALLHHFPCKFTTGRRSESDYIHQLSTAPSSWVHSRQPAFPQSLVKSLLLTMVPASPGVPCLPLRLPGERLAATQLWHRLWNGDNKCSVCRFGWQIAFEAQTGPFFTNCFFFSCAWQKGVWAFLVIILPNPTQRMDECS